MPLCPDVPFREARFFMRDRPVPVDTIVLQLSYGWANADKHAQFLQADEKQNKGTSVHFCIGRKGDTVQCVPSDCVAYHSGGRRSIEWDGKRVPNERSVGIRLCNHGPLRERIATAKKYARRAPFGFVRAQHPKSDRLRYWEQFGRPQMEALVELLPWIIAECPDVRYVCGEEDLLPAMLGPGPMFPWNLFPWEDNGLVRIEKDWQTGRWHTWRGNKRRPWKEEAA